MHDLQTVAFLQQRFRPAISRCDLVVQFYGDAVFLQLKVLDKLRE
jgi:DNA relaxase NicK